MLQMTTWTSVGKPCQMSLHLKCIRMCTALHVSSATVVTVKENLLANVFTVHNTIQKFMVRGPHTKLRTLEQ